MDSEAVRAGDVAKEPRVIEVHRSREHDTRSDRAALPRFRAEGFYAFAAAIRINTPRAASARLPASESNQHIRLLART
jgi:hypothetical protein